ncbi:MAG: Fe-S protein assembly co-chaperone HscB [Acidobacteriota bacterium]
MTRCYRCGHESAPEALSPSGEPTIAAYACSACGALQPPPPGRDHFARLGIAPAVRIDEGELSARFRSLSRLLHPDRFAKKEPRERRLALEHTTAINDAYRVLKDPVKRAEYVLSLHGVSLGEDRVPASDQGFLVEMMELREEVDEARRDPARAAAMMRRLSDGVNECLAAIAALTNGTGFDEAAARRALMRLKYLESARVDLGAAEHRR